MEQKINAWEVAYNSCGIVAIVLFVLSLGACVVPLFLDRPHVAKTTICISNLMQNGTGFMVYLGDYDDRLPPTASWMDAIKPYTKNDGAYHCPEAPKGSYGYAMERLLDRQETKNIEHPETVPLLFDSNELGRNAASTLLSLPAPPRHNGKVNNVCRLDGSVRSIRPAGPEP